MVVDDHPIIHNALETLLAPEEILSIDAVATSAAETMELLKTTYPDLVIIDLSLGDSDGTYLIQKIHNRYPKMRILVYSMSEENLFGERTACAGALGYVMKTSNPSILKEAIHTILGGHLFFSSETTSRILQKQAGRPLAPLSALDNLSNREMDIFKLIGEGIDTIHISNQLNISKNTVDTHRINIRNKLELPNGKALDRMAYKVIMQGKLPKKEA
jgi:DNA-binding NarL/FixJ family response regulator